MKGFDIPVNKSTGTIPEQPVIEVNPLYNPFDRDEPVFRRPDFIERFERENNWERNFEKTAGR